VRLGGVGPVFLGCLLNLFGSTRPGGQSSGAFLPCVRSTRTRGPEAYGYIGSAPDWVELRWLKPDKTRYPFGGAHGIDLQKRYQRRDSSLLSRFPAACMREAQAALSWRRSQRQCRGADPCSNPQLITCPGNSSFLSRHPRRPTPHQGTLCWSLDDSSLASFRCLLRKRSLAEGRRTLSNR